MSDSLTFIKPDVEKSLKEFRNSIELTPLSLEECYDIYLKKALSAGDRKKHIFKIPYQINNAIGVYKIVYSRESELSAIGPVIIGKAIRRLSVSFRVMSDIDFEPEFDAFELIINDIIKIFEFKHGTTISIEGPRGKNPQFDVPPHILFQEYEKN